MGLIHLPRTYIEAPPTTAPCSRTQYQYMPRRTVPASYPATPGRKSPFHQTRVPQPDTHVTAGTSLGLGHLVLLSRANWVHFSVQLCVRTGPIQCDARVLQTPAAAQTVETSTVLLSPDKEANYASSQRNEDRTILEKDMEVRPS
jgi:hypothetical protein